MLFTLVRSLFVLMCPSCRHCSPHNFASNDFQSIQTLIFLHLQRTKAFIYSEERCLMNDSALRGRSISSSLIEQNKSQSERLRMLNLRIFAGWLSLLVFLLLRCCGSFCCCYYWQMQISSWEFSSLFRSFVRSFVLLYFFFARWINSIFSSFLAWYSKAIQFAFECNSKKLQFSIIVCFSRWLSEPVFSSLSTIIPNPFCALFSLWRSSSQPITFI